MEKADMSSFRDGLHNLCGAILTATFIALVVDGFSGGRYFFQPVGLALYTLLS